MLLLLQTEDSNAPTLDEQTLLGRICATPVCSWLASLLYLLLHSMYCRLSLQHHCPAQWPVATVRGLHSPAIPIQYDVCSWCEKRLVGRIFLKMWLDYVRPLKDYWTSLQSIQYIIIPYIPETQYVAPKIPAQANLVFFCLLTKRTHFLPKGVPIWKLYLDTASNLQKWDYGTTSKPAC